jgi:hypothetical protein
MKDIKMILRRIISTDGDHSLTLMLECGHEVGPIAASKVPKKRMRCPDCEAVAACRDRNRDAYDCLVQHLHHVPMDDQVATLSEWITHYNNASEMCRSVGWETEGEFEEAYWLTQRPTTYPLTTILFGDCDE